MERKISKEVRKAVLQKCHLFCSDSEALADSIFGELEFLGALADSAYITPKEFWICPTHACNHPRGSRLCDYFQNETVKRDMIETCPEPILMREVEDENH
jgi:hypothetical protein